MRLYDLSVAMTNGGPGIASEVPAKFVMDHLFERGNLGLATAAATSMLITVAAVVGPLPLLAEPTPQSGSALMAACRRAGRGRARKPCHPARMGLYAFMAITALFFLVPLYVMLVTSFKTDA